MKVKNYIEPPARKRTILALDTATKCGWALWRDGKLINSGVWNFGSKTTGRKLSNFAAKLFEVIQHEQITEIVAEDIFLDKSKPKAFMSLGAMRGVLLSVVEYLDLSISFIEPQQHKRYLCRSSYATKADTQQALQRLGYGQIESNDEADAIAILLTRIKAPTTPRQPRKR